MLCDALVWSLDAIHWPETISALAAVGTAAIAFGALQTWKHQDKAKREAEFLDALIEAAHTYIAEIPHPIAIFEFSKIGMAAHAPTWENGEEADIAVKGAIAYIRENGEHDGKRLQQALETVQPSVIRLRSLAAKGQVFKFAGYAECQNAVEILTWQFNRIEAFMAFIRSPMTNWEHPDVLKLLNKMMAIDPNEIRTSIQDNNVALLKFVSATYKRIYG